MATVQTTSNLSEEIVDLLASCPSPKKLLQYRPSPEVQQRLRDSLRKNKEGSITKYEQWELDKYEYIESLMQMVKARLRSRKEQSNHE